MSGKQAACLFCKIIEGSIPSHKIIETELTYAFLDIGPLSKGHTLVIPKFHAAKLADVPDNYLADLLPTANKVVKALGVENYNLLQNNGRLAHQEVDHVHFHIIPKPNQEEGLGIRWPTKQADQKDLEAERERIKANI